MCVLSVRSIRPDGPDVLAWPSTSKAAYRLGADDPTPHLGFSRVGSGHAVGSVLVFSVENFADGGIFKYRSDGIG